MQSNVILSLQYKILDQSDNKTNRRDLFQNNPTVQLIIL
jgi:hypothetical protein